MTDERTLPPGLHRDTLALRTGLAPSQHGENSEALFLTSGFVQPDAETSARRFAGTDAGLHLRRTSNPTVTSFEQRLAALEGTEAAIGASTGMGAILMMCMGLLKAGDHVICSRSVFGSTLNLFGKEFAKFGVETTFVSQTDVAEWKAAVQAQHQAAVRRNADQSADRGLRHPGAGRPGAQRGRAARGRQLLLHAGAAAPGEFGADLIMHSGTKYLDGQGRVMAGAICGPSKLIVDVFGPVVRTAGMALAPFNAWVVLKGMETLSIRMQAQSANALAVAQWLETQPACARVLPRPASHPQHELAMRQQSGQGGAVVSFDVVGDTPEDGARQCLPGDQQHAGAEHCHQPGRHQDHHHAPRHHLARAPHRRAAPGRRHRPGPDPPGGRPGPWTTSRPTCPRPEHPDRMTAVS
jgi:O-succinylhomoserine sulfhydrylase